MKKKLIGIVVCMLLIGTVLPSGTVMVERTPISTFTGNTLYVGGSGPNNYTTIQGAIDDASDNDTVFVYDDSSLYYENIIVDKSINLIGEDRNTTVIDGDHNGDVVCLLSDNINISGFTIQNSGKSFIGISLEGIRRCYIYENIFLHNDRGIMLHPNSDDNIILDNKILNCTNQGIQLSISSDNIFSKNFISGLEAFSGMYIDYLCSNNSISNNSFILSGHSGIHIDPGAYNNIISDNFISSSKYNGIEVFKSNYNLILKNTILECSSGISFYHVNNSEITTNKIYNNDFGIKQKYCYNNIISDNTILNNSWDGILVNSSEKISIIGNSISADGIRLEDSNNNILSYNEIDESHDGILLIRSSSNSVTFNNINNNEIGVNLLYSSHNNICYNNFKRTNEKHAFFQDCDDNLWEANYWNRPRILPYIILGKITIERPLLGEIKVPSINFDLQPALKPYDIGI